MTSMRQFEDNKKMTMGKCQDNQSFSKRGFVEFWKMRVGQRCRRNFSAIIKGDLFL